MLLLELEEQIKPLSRPEKRKLFDFLALELEIELPSEVSQTARPGSADLQPEGGYPLWSQYEAYEAAKDFEDALNSADLPIL